MERESFENEQIAELMNNHFINIKVDREERPDLDEIYMNAVQMLTGRGGWPMTIFLTPDRQPFYGGTYYPAEDRHGMPGFPRILRGVAQAYRDKPEDVQKSVEHILSALSRMPFPGKQSAKLPNKSRGLTMPRMAAWGKHRNFPTQVCTSYFCASTISQEPCTFLRWSHTPLLGWR
jgi:uncharacterized protein YyaL (SSP411 family)